ncbi:gem-associated protein 8-like isoform X2 [Glandiceps talaboti]
MNVITGNEEPTPSRSTSTNEATFDHHHQLASSPGQPWHQDSCFRRYWKHYSDVRAWYYNHWFPSVSMMQQPVYPSHIPLQHHPFNCYHDNAMAWGANFDAESFYHYQNYDERQSDDRRVHNFQKEEHRNYDDDEEEEEEEEEEMDCHDNQEVSDSGDNEDGQVMEVSQQMKAFFALSEKHREERIYKASASTSHLAPSEKPGERRRQEMKILYGNDAAMIHGMETAIQLQFDRNYDKKQPKLWPTIPLKL